MGRRDTPMRAVVVVNPAAGPGWRRDLDARRRLAREILRRSEMAADVHITASPGEAERLAAEAVAAGANLVIAWGGDGTVNGVAAALVGTGTALGIVPAGSGNGLARALGLPRHPARALAVAATGRMRAIDAGDVAGSRFVNVAGIGLDAAIAKRLAVPGAQRGFIGYLRATLDELAGYRARAYRIRLDGETLAESALLIALANSCQYGAGARIAPVARPDDGRLDVVVVRDQSPIEIARRLPALFLGTLSDGPAILMRQAAAIEVDADAPLDFHVDGEPRTGPARLEIRTLPAALRVKVP